MSSGVLVIVYNAPGGPGCVVPGGGGDGPVSGHIAGSGGVYSSSGRRGSGSGDGSGVYLVLAGSFFLAPDFGSRWAGVAPVKSYCYSSDGTLGGWRCFSSVRNRLLRLLVFYLSDRLGGLAGGAA